MPADKLPGGKNVKVEIEDGIAWVTLNRPEKRNCMSPALNDEMVEVLDALEIDDRCSVLVLTGAGDAFSAGMDLREFFRATDGLPYVQQMRVRRSSATWQWHQLAHFLKPTIAMVNGWCFGGAFTPLISCDLAVAAEEAQFGVSEINWGIIPGGQVTRSLVFAMTFRNAMYYTLTGETFDGKQAAAMGIVNEAVPKVKLRERTTALANILKGKNPHALRACKEAIRASAFMPFEVSGDYLAAKSSQLRLVDDESGRNQGLSQFLDEKSYRPGLGPMRREKEKK
ncbi:MAG TPA: p-hydroxycinnamoyl CoA hydratase/lyase [Stellaceae bacterium]|nr:p-hydroxycinnamoyl CoA hydratase/lyase [Stellaceae bacterium]